MWRESFLQSHLQGKGLKGFNREDASGVSKVFVERFCVMFLNGGKKKKKTKHQLISCPGCSLNVLVFGKPRNPGALLYMKSDANRCIQGVVG